MLTQEIIKSQLNYNPETGIFTRLLSRCGKNAEKVVGTIHSSGYIRIGIEGKYHYAQRLVWLYIHGLWPENQMDHINGIRSDNRLANLRSVTLVENNQNRHSFNRNNNLGFLGVTRHLNQFRARIMLNGKLIHLGLFSTPNDAHSAYLSAKREIHATCTI